LASRVKTVTLDTNDGGDVGVPVSVGQCVGGIEYADGAAFVAVAAVVTAAGGAERRRGIREILDPLVQARLVVLDLNDERYVGFCRDLEMFFWQCSASSVTMVSLPALLQTLRLLVSDEV
jgi:hypothetical protein